MIVLEEIGLVGKAQVVDESDIEVVRPVIAPQIVKVYEVGAAAALRLGAHTQRPSPGKIRDGSNTMPITNSEGHKRSVVVAVTQCRLETDGRRLIAEHRPAKFPAGTRI